MCPRSGYRRICKAPFLNLSSPQVLVGICQGYSIRIDWVLIDGTPAEAPDSLRHCPYRLRNSEPPSSCVEAEIEEENALVHVHYNGLAITKGARMKAAAIPMHIMRLRVLCKCEDAILDVYTNNNRRNKWLNMSCVLYGIIEFLILLCPSPFACLCCAAER